MKAIIHIGIEKTGSTSIQKYLNQNRTALSDKNIFCSQSSNYCFPGDIYRSAKLLDYFLPYNQKTRLRDELDISQDLHRVQLSHTSFIDELNKELTVTDKNATFVFSDVSFASELVTDEQISKLQDLLSQYFTETTVFCYVRRQDKWLSSSFSEILKRGFVPTDLFNLTTSEVFSKKRELLKYHSLHSKWSNHFSNNKVIFNVFGKDRFHQGNLTDDFCYKNNLPMLTSDNDFHENISINMDGQFTLLCINQLYQHGEISLELQQSCMKYVFKTYPGKGFVPTSEQMKTISNYYNPENVFLDDDTMIIPSESDSSRQLTQSHINNILDLDFCRKKLAELQKRL